MKKVNLQAINIGILVLGALAIEATAGLAQASDVQSQLKIFKNSNKGFIGNSTSQPQVTSVSELKDVAPSDWAYEALRSLVERYGCIVGYGDQTFRGNQSLSRWEFAAGLNACLNTLERLIQENAVSPEDLARLKKLALDFKNELAALGARIDNLEQRVAFLEDHQFSTTTKLKGEVIFSLSDAFGSNARNTTAASWRNPYTATSPKNNSFGGQATLKDRVRLNFDSSFTGKDQLKVRLEAGNTGTPNLGTATGASSARLADDSSNWNPSNSLAVDAIWYKFPVGNLFVTIGANQTHLEDILDTYNPYLTASGTGSISRAERYNYIVYGPTTHAAGLGLKYKFSDQFALNGLYLAKTTSPSNGNQVSNPTPGFGLFNGSFSTGAQLDFTPYRDLKIGLTYIHSYDAALSNSKTSPQSAPNLFLVGSPISNNPFNGAAASADRFGLETSWNIFKGLNFTAWGGFASIDGHGPVPGTKFSANGLYAEVWSWNAALNVVDLGKQGAVLSFSGGLLPGALGINAIPGYKYPVNGGAQDRNASYVAQIQYEFPINQNIQLTPGFFVIFNPNNYAANNDIWVGVIRTVFSF